MIFPNSDWSCPFLGTFLQAVRRPKLGTQSKTGNWHISSAHERSFGPSMDEFLATCLLLRIMLKWWVQADLNLCFILYAVRCRVHMQSGICASLSRTGRKKGDENMCGFLGWTANFESGNLRHVAERWLDLNDSLPACLLHIDYGNSMRRSSHRTAIWVHRALQLAMLRTQEEFRQQNFKEPFLCTSQKAPQAMVAKLVSFLIWLHMLRHQRMLRSRGLLESAPL